MKLNEFRVLILLAVLLLAPGQSIAAPLDVQGEASPMNAMPGNNMNILLLVSVIDQYGAPVTGLDASSFKVDAAVVAPGGAPVDITRVDETYGSPGFYIIETVPTTYQGTQYTWRAGIYLLAVSVQRGADQGHTVIPLDMCNLCAQAASTTPSSGSTQQPETGGASSGQLQEGIVGAIIPGAARIAPGTLTPAGMPDLVVVSVTAGTPTLSEDGQSADVPLTVTIKNVGTSTSNQFKISTDARIAGENMYARPFTVPGQSDIWYPWQSGLGAGMTASFTGSVNIMSTSGQSLAEKMVRIVAKVDSCSGDEFMPEYCRVQESDETNNEGEVTVQLNRAVQMLTPMRLMTPMIAK